MNPLKAAGSLAGTAVRSIAAMQLWADETELARRKAICDACDFRSGEFCNDCSCHLPTKQAVHGSACGLGRWEYETRPRRQVDINTLRLRVICCDGCEARTGRRCTDCSCNIYEQAHYGDATCPRNKWPKFMAPNASGDTQP